MEYDRVATEEEILALTEQQQQELQAKAQQAEVLKDEETFEPYIIIDRVRYNIAPKPI